MNKKRVLELEKYHNLYLELYVEYTKYLDELSGEVASLMQVARATLNSIYYKGQWNEGLGTSYLLLVALIENRLDEVKPPEQIELLSEEEFEEFTGGKGHA